VEILKQLHEAVYRGMPELWPNNWILHHNNAPAHMMLSVKQFLAQKIITETEHPPCSLDLALNDLRLFPEIKSAIKRQFQDTEIQKKITTLKTIPQQEFHKCVHQWKHHWIKCIAAQGKYFKGDHSQ
jgi:hypothetical protein